MRILIILTFLFLNKTYAQNTNNYEIINLDEISASTLIYRENGFDFYFNKSDILKIINNNIDYYSNIDNNILNRDNEIKQNQDYYELIEKDDCQLILINPYKLTPTPSIEEIENNIQHQFSMKFHFIACDLIGSGKCKLKIGNVEIKTLIKKKIEESGDDYYSLKENYYTKKNSLIMSCLIEAVYE